MLFKLINQYSLILVVLAIVPLVAYIMWSLYSIKWAVIVTILFLLLSTGLFYVVRSSPDEVHIRDFQNSITSGEPVLLVIESDFCVACLSAQSSIDELAHKLRGHFRVLRVNTRSDLAKYLRNEYSWQFVPTFILFNKHGNEIWRQTGKVPSIDTLLQMGK